MGNLQEEIKCGFLIDKKRKKLWEIEIDLLNAFSRICKNHGINWFLIAGSAIGAVRHKGFIPWDDDIDIGMLRKDFITFLKYAQDELPNNFILQYGLKDNSEFHYFCRIRDINSTGIIREEFGYSNDIMGVFIELYPFDNVPTFKPLRIIHWNLSMILIEVIRHRIYHSRMGIKASFFYPILFPFSNRKLFLFWEKWCMKYNFKNQINQLVDSVSIPYYSKSEINLYKKTDLEETYEVIFENTIANLPKGNDRCLKHTYGDYMKLPPEEERGNHHNTYVYYDPFVSFRYYLENKNILECHFNQNK